MARHTWYKAPYRQRDSNYTRLTPMTRCAVRELDELLYQFGEVSGNVSKIAGLLGLDRKQFREAIGAIAEAGIFEIGMEDQGKAGVFYTIRPPTRTPTQDPTRTPTQDPTRAPDKSANDAGSGDSYLNKILPSVGEENRDSPLPPEGVSVNDPSKPEQPKGGPRRFEEFWSTYPRKKNKGQALKAWEKIKPDNSLIDHILKAVEAAKQSSDWLQDKGAWIPHPATWLNAMGWEDELSSPGAAGADLGSLNMPIL